LEESTARQITSVFKERVYERAPDISPEQVLVEIAEQDFGLARLDLPHSARSQIVQRLDSSTPDESMQSRQHSNGVVIPSNGKGA
jgi:hypothetical protein